MATNKKTTFWQFLSQYKIEIPIIQRDYAQGRNGKESLRKNFLNDLKESLENTDKKEMKLDFVYGSIENDHLYPLDGQQRLTTLWLLHWYIVLRSRNLENATKTLCNFSYETRTSSREFCQSLCNPINFRDYSRCNNIVEFITNQTWFYSAWKQDPTIQSMLRMLGGSNDTKVANDGIEKVFNCENCLPNRGCRFVEYYNKLTSDNCPIVFYYLDKDFSNSDDLYVKMNARGEQLTNFENFKADLIGYITKQKDNDKLSPETRNKWEKLLDEKDGIPIKLDTTWTEIFWHNKSKDYKIDEIYFAFFNRFFWNELFIATKDGSYILDIGKGEDDSTQENKNTSYKHLNNSDGNRYDYDTTISYKGFDVYKYYDTEIPFELFSDLQKVLSNYSKYLKSFKDLPEILGCIWDKDFKFIPIYEKDKESHIEIVDNSNNKIWKVSHLTQVQRVVFYAICKYFKDEDKEKDADKTALKSWMRVVWNLVSGEDSSGKPQIRNTGAIRAAIKLIGKLNSHDIYKNLTTCDIKTLELNESDLKDQFLEEVAKAKQILDENGNLRKYNGFCKKEDGSNYETWEKIIIEAESTAFFKGTIRFLFQNENGKTDIDISTGIWNTENFDTKFENAQKYFGKREYPTIELAKYCNDKQIINIWSNFSFECKNWKTILLQDTIAQPIHNFFMNLAKPQPTPLLEDINALLSVLKDSNNNPVSKVWLLQDWMSCKIVLTNYSTRRNEPYNGYVYEVGNWKRNVWNNIGNDSKEFEIHTPKAWGEEKYEINGQVYYRGLWTNFKYNEYYFAYYGNNTICLMNDNWNGKKLKDESKPNYPDNNFYFQVDREETSKSFFDKLNNFINEYTNHTNTNPNN